jgi:predicted cupin superfamily sugar epimerase
MTTAAEWITALGLEAHPEGGFYRETHRAPARIGTCCLGSEFDGPRAISTSIYYLLEGSDFSSLHRIRSDEVWHHHAGGSLTIHRIEPGGDYRAETLGLDPHREGTPQVVVPAGCWFGATVNDAGTYCLAGCTVAPGFDFRDLEIGRRDDLVRRFPAHREIIERLTR